MTLIFIIIYLLCSFFAYKMFKKLVLLDTDKWSKGDRATGLFIGLLAGPISFLVVCGIYYATKHENDDASW